MITALFGIFWSVDESNTIKQWIIFIDVAASKVCDQMLWLKDGPDSVYFGLVWTAEKTHIKVNVLEIVQVKLLKGKRIRWKIR